MFCAGRIPQDDLDRVAAACGGTILTTVSQINESVLGECDKFYEQQVGSERLVVLFYTVIHAGTTSLREARKQKRARCFFAAARNSSSPRRSVHSTTPSWSSVELRKMIRLLLVSSSFGSLSFSPTSRPISAFLDVQMAVVIAKNRRGAHNSNNEPLCVPEQRAAFFSSFLLASLDLYCEMRKIEDNVFVISKI